MERRRAVAIATATVATTLTAVAAVAANFGLLGFGAASSKPVGQPDAGRVAEVSTPAASPTTAGTASAPNVTVRYEDIYVPAPAAPAPTAPPAASDPVSGAPITAVAADTSAVTAEDHGVATGGYESGEDDDDHDREGGDDERYEEEEEEDD